MPNHLLQGTVTFIHHEKEYATIDYEINGKKKSINGLVGAAIQQKWKEEKIIKKPHQFRIGDAVSFIIVPTPRGDKQVADCVSYLYNNALTNMLQKATIDNKFVGYLKEAEGQYFVKETASYISFPLLLSPWEITPPANFLNEPVFFQLDNIENPERVTASLCRHQFIPAYNKALMHFKNQTEVAATITAIKPHALELNLFNGQLEGKLKKAATGDLGDLKIGDELKVLIQFLSPFKIVLAKA